MALVGQNFEEVLKYKNSTDLDGWKTGWETAISKTLRNRGKRNYSEAPDSKRKKQKGPLRQSSGWLGRNSVNNTPTKKN